MLYFENDYSRGAHPKIIEALTTTNLEPLSGYGYDPYTQLASERIKAACQLKQGEVQLLAGGTQTNTIVIASILKPFEGVLAPQSGHIAVHEAGAIERTGHKVLTLPDQSGKISAHQVESYMKYFYADQNHSHMVFPGMVYISQPTEYGSLYSQQELQDLAQVCQAYQLPLYVDGARLAYALASPQNDVTLADLAKFADIFYFGGTKAGLLCGEAVVFTRKDIVPAHFDTLIKQHGALLAKGRLLGIQFATLFTDKLYLEIGQSAVQFAHQIKEGLLAKGYQLLLDSPTNQQFIIIANHALESLSQTVKYSFWEAYDDQHTVIRLATDWATSQADVNQLLDCL